jgi:NADPH:quinone reductase-like Zn-dependent oxidoreductase
VPGLDVAGTIAELGADADGFAVGDKVFGMLFPALGSFAAADRWRFWRVVRPVRGCG